MSRPRSWTDDQLKRVLDEGNCRTWMDVVIALGLGPWAVNRRVVVQVAKEHGWELKRPAPSGAGRGDGGR